MNTASTGNSESNPTNPAEPQWKPLNPTQRRVLGVLIEKAKTTPEQYPLSLNGLTTGCNQKNNRDPVTELAPDQVEQALDELRTLGAVLEIQGTGRVAKYKHCLYEWLGVDKVELAVMAELLLRGEQTIGELRGRAARMEPIADLRTLRPILQSLKHKRLLLELTPEGRGQIVSHGLYKERELPEVLGRTREIVSTADRSPADESAASPRASGPRGVTADMFSELQLEVAELRAELARIRGVVQELQARLTRIES